jgi:hypothetical protein
MSDVRLEIEAVEKEMDEKRALVERERQARMNEIKGKLVARLEEVRKQIDALENEENYLRGQLGQAKIAKRAKAAKASGAPRGRRVTTAEKKEIVARFIKEGYISHNTETTPALRAALKDAGFKPYDVAKIGSLLPEGWVATSNGQRGLSAKTVFTRK